MKNHIFKLLVKKFTIYYYFSALFSIINFLLTLNTNYLKEVIYESSIYPSIFFTYCLLMCNYKALAFICGITDCKNKTFLKLKVRQYKFKKRL